MENVDDDPVGTIKEHLHRALSLTDDTETKRHIRESLQLLETIERE